LESEAGRPPLVKRALCDDAPAIDHRHDALGFGVHVRALGELLTADATPTPVTVSIEGEWGSGKTSFLRQLQTYVQKNGSPNLFFNAWRHDKSESLWAAFALACVEALRSRYGFFERTLRDVRLTFSRFDFEAALPDLIVFVFRLLLFAFVLWASLLLLHVSSAPPFTGKHAGPLQKAVAASGTEQLATELVGYGGITGAAILLVLTVVKIKELVGDPFEINLRKYVADPGYKSRVTFAETFHRDFARIVADYLKGRKFFVFIDDLDRCEPQQAAELLQSINILTSASVRGPAFIIGMDRKIVAAALANKNSEIVSYLAPASSATSTVSSEDALDYGYAFMDKFIQLPLRVPRARREHLERLLQDDSPTADSLRAKHVIVSAAAILDYNPRRLKQFINVFRLNVHTFVSAGRIKDTPITKELLPGMQELTIEKLGLFLSIVLRWPRLTDYFANDPKLLCELQKLANDGNYKSSRELPELRRFKGVIACLGVMENSSFPAALWTLAEREKIFSLEEINIAEMLATIPAAGREWTLGMEKVPEFSEVVQVAPAGHPSLVLSSRPWHQGALELVYPLRAGRLVHCRYDPSDGKGWQGLETFGSDTAFQEVALIQSDYLSGNLEAIARREGALEFLYRPSDDALHWRVPYSLGVKVVGRPLLLQSVLGENGNFELVVPLASGGLQHWWRDNTANDRPWRPETIFAEELSDARLFAMFEVIVHERSDLIVFCQSTSRIFYIRRENYQWARPQQIADGVASAAHASALQAVNRADTYDFFLPAAEGGIDYFVYDDVQGWRKVHTFAQNIKADAIAAAGDAARQHLIVRSSEALHYMTRPAEAEAWSDPIDIIPLLEGPPVRRVDSRDDATVVT
jgi:KAP family P-loop domain